MRGLRRVLRPVSCVVLVTFTALTLQPLTAAAQLPSAPKRTPAQAASGEERFSRTLNEIHEILKEVAPRSAMPHMFKAAPTAPGKPGEKVLQAVGPKLRLESERAQPLPGVDVAAKVKTLRGKYKELKSLEAEVDKGFKATEKHIRDKNLPPEILARHEAAVAEYDRRKAEFETLMQAVETAADAQAGSPQAGSLQGALASLGEFMAKYPNQKTHTPTDPNNLPWGSPKPVTRAPYTSPAQFKTSRLFGEPVKVAQAGSLSGISLPTTVLPNTPTPADTAPTEDVQITQAIRDLATSLGNQPVPIYNWVRNNIQFIPSYGSIQGSDMTLQTKRGNAFDTASLLIALFRAANIPARYVYGTIEVPADKVMNWVGGVTVPQAAMNLMGQGGIPNIGIGSGGQIRSIRMEHVWVEAYVDYTPSRGAVNRVPDTWVPMDASFKQYRSTQGMDIETNVPLDAQSFLTHIQQGAIVNEAEGWIQNVNQTLVEQTLTNYQTRVTNYVNAQNPTATVGDVLGTQTIIAENRPILLGTLPYVRIATGAKFQAIPDSLRHKLAIKLYASATDRGNDSAVFEHVASLPTLAGKRISLAYDYATPSDKSVVASAFGDGQTTFSAYLVSVTPILRIENANVRSGNPLNLGQDHFLSVTVTTPTYQREAAYPVTSGDVAVLVANPAGLGLEVMSPRAATHDFTQQAYPESAEEMLFQIGLSYWAERYAFDQLIGESIQVRAYQLPGHALASAPLNVQYAFGIARKASYANRALDVRENYIIADHIQGDPNIRKRYLRAIGYIGSYFEGSIFEQHLLTVSGAAVSSVAALKEAESRNIPIHVISGENLAVALALLSLSVETKDRIANAVSAGMTVTIPRSNVTIGNFVGVGYIIEDPQTGTAAYELSGGTNGGGAPAPGNVFAVPETLAQSIVDIMASAHLRRANAQLAVSGGKIVGIVFKVAETGTTGGGGIAAVIALLATLLMILQTINKETDSKHPRIEKTYRKYRNLLNTLRDIGVKYLRETLDGTHNPNPNPGVVYLALPDDIGILRRTGGSIACPPTSDQAGIIAEQLEMPSAAPPYDSTLTSTYYDLRITRAFYYEIDELPNNHLSTEIILRAPLFRNPFDPGDQSRYLYFGPFAFGIEQGEVCAF